MRPLVNRLFKLLLATCLVLVINQSWAQDSTAKAVQISGYAYERPEGIKDTLIPLIGISVINMATHHGTITGGNGYFSINVRQGDSILFKSIAHVPDTYFVDENEPEARIFLRVKLRRATLTLKQTNVYAISYSTFKHEVLNMEIKDTESVYIPPMVGFVEPNQSFAIIRFSPFTAIYNNFSKAGKEQKKLSALLAADKREEFLDSVYKQKFVLNFLSLPESEMNTFIDYCNLSPKFISTLNDYELLLALSQCYEGYERKKAHKR